MPLDALTREVHETSSVIESAIALLNGLGAAVRAAASDPAAVQALADELDAKQAALAAAIAANTIAAVPSDEV